MSYPALYLFVSIYMIFIPLAEGVLMFDLDGKFGRFDVCCSVGLVSATMGLLEVLS